MVITCTAALERAARWFSKQTAVRCIEGEFTYEQAWTRGLKLATALRALGLSEQDRVATLEDNSLGAVDTLLATSAANMVRVPLYPSNALDAHVHMLTVTGAKLLIVDQELATTDVRGLAARVPTLQEVLVREEGYNDWIGGLTPIDRVADTHEDDLHLIRFSGGTTGLPKGIPFSNRVWMSGLRDLTYCLPRMEPGDVCMYMGTLSHGAGYLFLPSWMQGCIQELVLGFDAEKVIDLMEHGGTSFSFAAPSMLAALVRAKNAKGKAFQKLKALWIAGAPISRETAMLSREVFGERVFQTCAQTEASPGFVMNPKEWFSAIDGSDPLDSAGRPAPWTEVEVRDDDNRPVPAGHIGEIAYRCDGQFPGYMGAPELSAEKVRDGWILSGDIGYLDANGLVYIVDRKGAMIISGGYNIWPAELEQVISKMPGILEVAVVPIPHDRWGESPLAICYACADCTLTEEEVIDRCAKSLGSYKKPGRVLFQNFPLPKTSVEKIDRRALKEPYWAGHAKRVAGT